MPDNMDENQAPPEARENEETQEAQEEAKQCRICLDGEDPALGRLIRPCLCKGSISVRRLQDYTPPGHAQRTCSMSM